MCEKEKLRIFEMWKSIWRSFLLSLTSVPSKGESGAFNKAVERGDGDAVEFLRSIGSNHSNSVWK